MLSLSLFPGQIVQEANNSQLDSMVRDIQEIFPQVIYTSTSSHFKSGVVPVDGVDRIWYGHWSVSIPLLAISFDHIHPLSLVHFSSFHSVLAFSTFVLVFLFLYYCTLQISKPLLLYFHLLSSKHDRTTAYYLLYPPYPKTFLNPTCPSTPRCLFDLIASHHSSLGTRCTRIQMCLDRNAEKSAEKGFYPVGEAVSYTTHYAYFLWPSE